jgi:hypothetical protein
LRADEARHNSRSEETIMNQIQRDQHNFTLLTNEIELMKQAIDGYQRKVSKPHVCAKLVNECRGRIFNAAWTLGSFDLALEYADTDEQKAIIERLKTALATEEIENCSCVEDALQNARGVVSIITKFVKYQRMYDPNKLMWIDLYKCVYCGFMTDKTSGAHFESSRRLESARNAGGKKKDVEVL